MLIYILSEYNEYVKIDFQIIMIINVIIIISPQKHKS